MYFIFLNSKMAVYKLKLGAQFGLAHMIGTNLCVWLNVLVQETRHEILMFYNPDNGTIIYPNYQGGESHGMRPHSHGHGFGHESTTPTILTTTSDASYLSDFNSTAATMMSSLEIHSRIRRGLKGPYSFQECRRSDIMGSLVQNASPFLFPCTIEFSLICSAVLYVVSWVVLVYDLHSSWRKFWIILFRCGKVSRTTNGIIMAIFMGMGISWLGFEILQKCRRSMKWLEHN